MSLENISKSKINELLKTTWKESANFQKGEGKIVVDDVSFFFNDDKLISIKAE